MKSELAQLHDIANKLRNLKFVCCLCESDNKSNRPVLNTIFSNWNDKNDMQLEIDLWFDKFISDKTVAKDRIQMTLDNMIKKLDFMIEKHLDHELGVNNVKQSNSQTGCQSCS